jgi:hypothetical protein
MEIKMTNHEIFLLLKAFHAEGICRVWWLEWDNEEIDSLENSGHILCENGLDIILTKKGRETAEKEAALKALKSLEEL